MTERDGNHSPEVDALRAAFRERTPLDDEADCIPSDEMYAAVAGDLSADETARIIDHIANCVTCSMSWQLAQSLVDEPQSATVVELPKKRAIAAPWTWLAAAATIAFGVGVSLMFVPEDQDVTPVYRGGDVEAVSPVAVLNQADGELVVTWQQRDERQPRSATIRVYNVGLALVFTRQVQFAPSLKAPASIIVERDALALLEPGDTFFWQVDMTFADGTTHTSETQSATIH